MLPGSGTNAQRIIEHFEKNSDVEISLVLTNNEDAYVLKRSAAFDIPAYVFNRQMFFDSDLVHDILRDIGIDFIVLAGFLWLVLKIFYIHGPDELLTFILPYYPSLEERECMVTGCKGRYRDRGKGNRD